MYFLQNSKMMAAYYNNIAVSIMLLNPKSTRAESFLNESIKCK